MSPFIPNSVQRCNQNDRKSAQRKSTRLFIISPKIEVFHSFWRIYLLIINLSYSHCFIKIRWTTKTWHFQGFDFNKPIKSSTSDEWQSFWIPIKISDGKLLALVVDLNPIWMFFPRNYSWKIANFVRSLLYFLLMSISRIWWISYDSSELAHTMSTEIPPTNGYKLKFDELLQSYEMVPEAKLIDASRIFFVFWSAFTEPKLKAIQLKNISHNFEFTINRYFASVAT